MTKPNPYNTCIYCGTKFKKSFKRQNICTALCAFWSRVEKGNDCWLWTGSTHVSGYGEFRFNSKLIRAHRFSYEIHNGPLGSLYACHTCDNPTCVNPSHIVGGTHADNMRHMAERSRAGQMKLSPDQVREIREKLSSGATQSSLAKEYGVTCGTINHIHLRRNGYREHVK